MVRLSLGRTIGPIPLLGGVDGSYLRVQVRTRSCGWRPLAAGLVPLEGRRNVRRARAAVVVEQVRPRRRLLVRRYSLVPRPVTAENS